MDLNEQNGILYVSEKKYVSVLDLKRRLRPSISYHLTVVSPR
jgi:hypothetical protein